jgi:imidazolonepropionase-like amidohydrolase
MAATIIRFALSGNAVRERDSLAGMARPRTPPPPVHLRSARLLDVDKGELIEPGELLVDGERIVEVAPSSVPDDAVVIDLGDLTLLPGLMDMEVNLLMGGPDHRSPLVPVQDDPAVKTLRAVANARRTLRAGFTTVRNLGLFVQTGGILLDVALQKAIDLGWIDGPRVVPAGHAITPTGGHLDPTMFQAFAPHVLPLTVEEGIADGVAEVRKAVRYQIKHGAQLIKVCASGGVMSHTGPAGAQQYSDDELRAVADEAHRAGLKVAAHAHGDDGIRAAIEAGIDCIEHGSLMSDETLDLMIERGTFLVPTTYLADGMDVSHAGPELQAKAAEVFPRAKRTISKAIDRGARIACGTDAPAIPHGRNAKELIALVDRGMTPLQAIRAATTVAAELINVDDRGRLEAGLLADVIGVPGDPLADITETERVRFVMKGGQVYRHDEG